MPRKHKGDRARITSRLPKSLVARVDACAELPKAADRNERIEALLEVGLDALRFAEVSRRLFLGDPTPLLRAADLLGAIATDDEDRALVQDLRNLAVKD